MPGVLKVRARGIRCAGLGLGSLSRPPSVLNDSHPLLGNVGFFAAICELRAACPLFHVLRDLAANRVPPRKRTVVTPIDRRVYLADLAVFGTHFKHPPPTYFVEINSERGFRRSPWCTATFVHVPMIFISEINLENFA